jgi:hypothetical protein
MAIRWLVSAWELDVKGITLANCFTKSRVMPTEEERLLDDEVGLRRGMRPGTERVGRGRNMGVRRADDEDDEEATSPAPPVEREVQGQPGAELEIDRLRSEIGETASRLCQLGHISAALPADNFIAPDDEGVDDPDDDLVAHIVASIDVIDTESPDDIEAEAPEHLISHDSALTYANSLIAYAEQQPTSDRHMRSLHALLQTIKQRQLIAKTRRVQQTLDSLVE